MDGTPIPTLLWTVIEAILEVFILCTAGWVLARIGVVDRTTQKKLNRINVSLFTPCLLFSKVAFYLSPGKLRELWIIPIMFCVVTLVSAAWAWMLSTLLRLKRSQRSFAMAASMFMNSNSLPIALMQSLVVTVPGLKWGQDDNGEAMVGRALTYLVVYSTLGMMLRWSYGVHLLTQADEEVTNDGQHVESGEREPLLTPGETGFPPAPSDPIYQSPTHAWGGDVSSTDFANHESEGSPELDVGHLRPPQLKRAKSSTLRHFRSFPDLTSTSTERSETVASTSSEHDGDEWRDPRTLSAPTRSRFHSILRRIQNIAKGVNEFMTVPMWASIASIVVACVPILQHFLEEHARPVKGSIVAAGSCSIPVTLVVLGAYFYTPMVKAKDFGQNGTTAGTASPRRDLTPSTVQTNGHAHEVLSGVLQTFKLRRKRSGKFFDSESPLERRGERTTVAISVISRMILTPAVLLPLFALSAKLGAHAVFEDPVFLVANVLLISSPPALTLAQITQAASGDAFERLISKTIFWSYCIFTPPLTIIYVMLGMLLTKM